MAGKLATAPIVFFSFLIALGIHASGQTSENFDQAIEHGRRAMTLANFQEATSSFDRAVHLRDTSPLAHELLATALMHGTQEGLALDKQVLERAKTEEETALRLSPNEPDALAGLAEATYRLGFPVGSSGLLNESTGTASSIEILKKALTLNPDAYYANFELAHIESRKLAAAMFRLIVRLPRSQPGGKSQMPVQVKHDLLATYGDPFKDAIEHANKALRAQPLSFAAMKELAGLFQLRSYIQERDADSKSDMDQSANWTAKAQLAYAQSQREANHPNGVLANFGSFDEAVKAGRNAIAKFNYEEAIAAFSKSIAFKEKSAESHIDLANALILSASGAAAPSYPFDPERLGRAEQEDLRALALQPQNAEAMAGLADANFALSTGTNQDRSSAVATARNWAEKALAVDPNNFHGNYVLANISFQEFGPAYFKAISEASSKGIHDAALPAEVLRPLREKYGPLIDQGLRCAQNALKSRPDSYLAMYQLANLYLARHDLSPDTHPSDIEVAQQWRAKAIKLLPKDDPNGSTIRADVIAGMVGAGPPPPPPSK